MAILAETAEYRVKGTFLDDITRKASRAFDQFKKSAGVAAKVAAGAIVAGTAAMIAGITKFVAAANQQELAIAKLEGTLRSTGQFTAEYSQQLQEMASAFQKATTFGDELILEQQGILLSMGATRDNIQQVTQAALDLSAGLGVDLRSSTLLLGKALAGEFGSLSRYGIIIDKNASQSEKLALALDQINSKFGGQAAAQAATFGGRIQQLSNSFGDLLEQLGFVVNESELLQDLLTFVRVKFDEWGQTLQQNKEQIIDLVENGIRWSLIAFEELVEAGKVMISIFEALWGGLKVFASGVTFLLAPIGKLTDLLGWTTNGMDKMFQASERLFSSGAKNVTSSFDDISRVMNRTLPEFDRATDKIQNISRAATAAAPAIAQLGAVTAQAAADFDEFGKISEESLDELGRTADEAMAEAREATRLASLSMSSDFGSAAFQAELAAGRMGNAFVQEAAIAAGAVAGMTDSMINDQHRLGGGLQINSSFGFTGSRVSRVRRISDLSQAEIDQLIKDGLLSPSPPDTAPSNPTPRLPGFASGISRVPRDMVAVIHKDEAVLNRTDAAAFRGGAFSPTVNINVSGRVDARAIAVEVRNALQTLAERSR